LEAQISYNLNDILYGSVFRGLRRCFHYGRKAAAGLQGLCPMQAGVTALYRIFFGRREAAAFSLWGGMPGKAEPLFFLYGFFQEKGRAGRKMLLLFRCFVRSFGGLI